MRNAGLTEQAHAKIVEHEMIAVPIEPERTGADETIPLFKYIWMHPTTKEIVEWLDHMIADFQERKVKLLNDPASTGEYFREYVQDTNLDKNGAVVFLSLEHGPDFDPENKYPTLIKIKEYNWTDEQIAENLFGEEK